MMDMKDKIDQKLNKQAGIAIGPILFIVAILGVLAAAISAGGSGFSGQTASDSAKTNAGAILDIGQNLKSAATRIMVTYSAIPDNITVTGAATNYDLFSITGGTLAQPSNALADLPTHFWTYSTFTGITNLGTASAKQLMASLQVTQAVCKQINNILTGSTAITTTTGTIASNTAVATTVATNAYALAWPIAGTTNAPLSGCVADSTGNWFFYQFIATQ